MSGLLFFVLLILGLAIVTKLIILIFSITSYVVGIALNICVLYVAYKAINHIYLKNKYNKSKNKKD